ncbi:MAG: diguanylate cyclase [Desulfamplus sp.]|nr:diguanylate cyclase [Desulfamplus sp.]
MEEKKRIIALVLIMAVISIITVSTAIRMLYNTAFQVQKDRLIEIVQSHARLVEAVANFNIWNSQDYKGSPRDATILQIRDAHRNFKGFGTTGEYTMGELQNDQIVFLITHRHQNIDTPKTVPIKSSLLAEPMRRALSGNSGTVIGLDYRGETVLAAYEFVKNLNVGLVAKIDLSEIRAPFIRTSILVFSISLILIVIGSLLFLRITNPLIKKLTILAKFPNENPNPVIRVSKDCTVLYSNNAGAELLESINSKRPGEKETFQVPETMQAEIVKAIEKRAPSKFDLSSDDKTYHFVVSPIDDINSAYLYGIDITERIELMNELRLNTAVFMNTTEGVMICDKHGDIQSVNPAFVDITGYQACDVIGKNPRLLKSGRHDNKFYETMWDSIIKHGNWKGEIWNRRKDGNLYPQDTAINTITTNKGVINWYASIFRDITKRKETEKLLIRLSSTDGLTGIANRRTFDETLEKEWKRALRSAEPISIAMIDIDHFKPYNDNYGHQQGDICLKKVALALQGCISRSTDLLARYGGEEFVVIMPMT